MAQELDSYDTPTRRRHLAPIGGVHRYRFSWLRIRWECVCGRRICYRADAMWTARRAAR